MTTIFTPYASVLNALDKMAQSPAYAVRAPDIRRAENLIVNLITELESVKEKLAVARASADQWDALQAMQTHKYKAFLEYIKGTP